MAKYPTKQERVVRAGGENKGKTREMQRVPLTDAKASLYRALLDLGGDAGVFTVADQALMQALLQDPDIQARFERVFRTMREEGERT